MLVALQHCMYNIVHSKTIFHFHIYADWDECDDTNGTVCQHECHDMALGYICGCHGGYVLMDDGQSCQGNSYHCLSIIYFDNSNVRFGSHGLYLQSYD